MTGLTKTVAAALLLMSIAVSSGCGGSHDPTEAYADDDLVTVISDEYEIQYAVDNDADIVDGVATMVQQNDNLNTQLGASLVVHFLDEDAAELFDKKHGNSSNCPASFFNRHAKQFFMVPGNETVAEQLDDWEIDNYQNVTDWENVEFEGQCVQGIVSVRRLRDDATRTDVNGMNDCQIFILDSMVAASRYD